MEQLIFTNSQGEFVLLWNREPYVLKTIDGTGAVRSEVQTQKAPYQDGGTYIDSVLEERDIFIEVGIFAGSNEEVFEHRERLARVFNPKLGLGELRYMYYEEERYIEVAVVKAPEFPGQDRAAGYQRCLIHLVAPNPLWLSPLITEEPMAAYTGLFSFPLEIPEEEGIEMGFQIETRTVENDGDTATPVYIEFFGPAAEPEVSNNTTGEFIRVNRSISANEKLVIDTEFGNKKVEVEKDDGERENAFNWIDLESSFWQLQVGENELEYRAEEGQDDATVRIRWRKRYMGV